MHIKLVINPDSDREFGAAAEALLTDGADTPRELEARLRERYPRATVADGIDDGSARRWYVYRDGRWVAAGAPDAPQLAVLLMLALSVAPLG